MEEVAQHAAAEFGVFWPAGPPGSKGNLTHADAALGAGTQRIDDAIERANRGDGASASPKPLILNPLLERIADAHTYPHSASIAWHEASI